MRRRNVAAAPSDHSGGERSRVAKTLRRMDVYSSSKVIEDFRQSSSMSGGIITCACALLCFVLFVNEYFYHRTPVVKSSLTVDATGLDAKTSANSNRLHVEIDITFHQLPCDIINMDTMDQAGEAFHDVHSGHLKKRRLDSDGKPLEGVFKHEKANAHKEIREDIESHALALSGDEEYKTSEEDLMPEEGLTMFNLKQLLDKQFPGGIEKAFKNEAREGCEVIGYLEVNRVPGSFSVSPGKSIRLGMEHVQLNVQSRLNMSHTINRFAFGKSFPGFVSPLDGNARDLDPNYVHQYFLKIVPTSFTPLRVEYLQSNQYSVTEASAPAKALNVVGSKPSGVYFNYDLSPLRVRVVSFCFFSFFFNMFRRRRAVLSILL